jgi:hypothetical protein
MDSVKKELPKAKQYEGMSQYRPPLCFELVGKTYELVLDNGYDYELSFIDRKNLSYGLIDGEKKGYAYDCLKVDDDTFFVNFDLVGETPRSGLTFVLDTEQSLVTAEYIRIGVNPKLLKQPYTEIIFGAIRRADGSIPSIRHGYTTDMIGKAIHWRYGTMSVVHVYSSERYYRLTTTPEEAERRRAQNPEAMAERERLNALRLYEEPADYIKIKDGIYVFNMTETMANRERGQGNNLLFAMNLNRMYDVGRSFGFNGEGQPENYTYGAYGEYYDESELLARKSTEFIR